MLLPFKVGLGGRTGDGRQWMSWIDVQDMVGGILHILKSDLLQGAVNMVAPKPVRNARSLPGRWPSCWGGRRLFPCLRLRRN